MPLTSMPTFLVIKSGREVSRILGADPAKLSDAVKKLAAEAESSSSSSSAGFGESSSGSGYWLGLDTPRGYGDITEQVDVKDLDMLNADNDFGNARTLFDASKPSQAEKSGGEGGKKDWVETDTDDQLMLYVPFQSTVKIHSLQITSLLSSSDSDAPMRPKTIKLFTNRPSTLGFEEADDLPPTQAIEIKAADWDTKTGTAKVDLRFVKFQNVTSLVVFVVNGDGDGDRVRIDRIRIVGESGQKREMGKLEKVGEES